MHFVCNGIICHSVVFHPFSCIGKVLQKIIFDNATDTLIAPDWRSRFGLLSFKTYYCQKHLSCHQMEVICINQIHLISSIFVFKNLELMAYLVLGKALTTSLTYPVGL